jgi:hypothetical protein
MILDEQDMPFFCPAMFPVERALVETRPLPRSSLFRAWRPRQKNWHAGRKGNGTRRAQALLRRLDVKGVARSKKRF